MPIIQIETMINAPIERVFDLARSIDAHQHSAEGTTERAIAGVTFGLIGKGEYVTWEATHFGVRQRLRVKITELEFPSHFQDVMISGAFNHMIHDHYFEARDGNTMMMDKFSFGAPLGPLGWIAERLFLESYMRRFLVTRNQILKRVAESDEWRKYLK